MTLDAYRPRRVSRSRFVSVRGLTTHIREWGDENAPLAVLLHGFQDASATFQFMVDAFRRERHFVAPDWRGHGQTDWAPQGYWFQDYVCDLDLLLAEISPDDPVTLVGHSLGGNVAHVYAAARPERIRRIVSLDGFGLREPDAAQAPARLRNWLRAWREPAEPSRAYADVPALAARLRAAHPRLSMDKALFLAETTSRRLPSGEVMVAFDPRHRMPFAIPHRRDEFIALLRAVEAPALWIESGRTSPLDSEPGGLPARRAIIRDLRFHTLPETSHNLHHDAPDEVARLIEAFLDET